MSQVSSARGARRRCLLVALLGTGFVRASAGGGPAEIRWNELSALIVGHPVAIPLATGTEVAGEALSVRDDALMLDIRKTSDARRYPKGEALIPRTAVTEIRLTENRGAGARVLGSAVGALVGIVAGAEIAAHGTRTEGAAVSTFTAAAVACTVGGYYAGRSVDRHSRLLRIAPAAGAGSP